MGELDSGKIPISPKLLRLLSMCDWLLAPLRALAPFRVVNGYGVFPPKALPTIRVLPVLEGSHDGVHWRQYGYRHMPSFPHSRPRFLAPYMEAL